MFKLDLEKAEELEIKLPTFTDYVKAFDFGSQQTGKFLKRWGNQTILPASYLRNLYAGQETTVRIGHGTTDWFQIGKGAYQGCILSPCLLNLYAEYIMRNARLVEAPGGI